jgi:competence protein ComEC
MIDFTKKTTFKIVFPLLLLFAVLTTSVTREKPEFRGELEIYKGQGKNVIHFLNTMCQDAILLESNGKFALIDGAEPDTDAEGKEIATRDGHARYIIDYILRVTGGSGKLDFVIATHPHVDHMAGLNQILQDQRITTDRIYAQKQSTIRGYYGELLNVAGSRGFEIVGDNLEYLPITLGDVTVTLLNTLRPDLGNQGSMMQLVEVNGFKALLMADVAGNSDRAAEINSFLPNENAKLDIVKVGHHGLRGDMPASFLELLPPIGVAVYTNHEQWVNEVVWKDIANHGATQYITSVFGGIAAVFNGKSIEWFAINEDPYTEDGFYARQAVTLD